MPGILSQLVLVRVLKSARAFETTAVSVYQGLREKLTTARSCSEVLDESLCRLLAEEEMHQKILDDIISGDLSELERTLDRQGYSSLENLESLDDSALSQWGRELESALEQEEKTWIFYTNLQRMSRIPAVRKAFAVLGSMEKGHLDILRRLLGRS